MVILFLLLFGFVPQVTGNKIERKAKEKCRSHIEDLAFRNRPSREPGHLGRRAPIEPGPFRVLKLILAVNKVQRFELIGRSYAGAGKGGEGMALKISTKAETFSFALT